MVVSGGCKPYRTTLMKLKGVDWVSISGSWYMVCEFCHGNCGQCGLTGYVDDVPFNMQAMVDNLQKGRRNDG